jgi:hypothetical protein
MDGTTLNVQAMPGVGILSFTGWQAGWTKPDRRPIYEWAHDNLVLPPSYSIPGRFDVMVNRPLMAVFDDIQNSAVKRIRFRKPTRFGGSLIADIAIPWIVCNDPGPIMWNWQSDVDAAQHMKEKAWALWKSCRPFKALLPPNRHDKTTTEIFFGPFFLLCQGANLNNLQSKGIRWLFNDELWLPVWQELYQHAIGRTRDFERAGNDKVVDVSQAGNANDVEDRNWQQGHQAVWGYLAKDGKHYPLEFGGKHPDGRRWGLIWADDAKKNGRYNKARAIETARYVCRFTGQEWLDDPRTIAEWNAAGAYIATNPNASNSSRSYSVNALLNRTFASLIEEKIDAMELAARGDMTALRDFKQKAECVPWQEVHLTVEISTERNGYTYAQYANGEKWDGELYRMMSIDRQHGIGKDVPHRWVEVRAFKPNGDSRQLWFGRLETKEACRDLQQKLGIIDRCVWQDARFEKHEVFKECVEYGWIAVMGSQQNSWTHYTNNPGQPETKVTLPYSPIQRSVLGPKQDAYYLFFNEEYMSDILHNLISGRGARFEMPDDVSSEYIDHLKAEHKLEKRPGVYKWEKLHSTKPNHGRDTSKQAVAFACLAKLLALPKPTTEQKVA